MCIINYNKTFNCVQWRKLWNIMQEMRVPEHLIDLIRNIYTKSRAAIKVEDALLETF